MTPPPDSIRDDPEQPLDAQVLRLVQQLGRIILNANIYGTAHRMTIDAVREAFPLVYALNAASHPIALDVLDDTLYIDARRCSVVNRLTLAFVQRLNELGVSGFTIFPGMDDDEFLNVLDLLLAPPPEKGGPDFHAELARRGLQHVRAAQRELRSIGEEEIVLNREELDQLAAESGAAEETGAPEETGATEPPPSEPTAFQVEQVIAFLKGDIGGDQALREQLREMIDTPEKLAQLILEATAVRRSNGELPDGESLADFVIGCLRRTFDNLRSAPEYRSASAKRSLKKAVLMLEREVVDKLRTLLPDQPGDWQQWIDQACAEISEDIEIEALAIEYARHARALAKTEKKLLRRLENAPPPESPPTPGPEEEAEPAEIPEWKQITWELNQKNKTPQSPAAPPLPEDLGVLAVLLTELDRLMRAGKLDPQTSKSVRSRIEKEVETLAAKAREGIQALGEITGQEGGGDSPPGQDQESDPKKQAKEKEVLAEIVQQLCQLAVSLNGSLAMITYGLNNSIPAEHWDILTIAVRSGRELNDMLQFLRSKVGLPHTLRPVDPKKMIIP